MTETDRNLGPGLGQVTKGGWIKLARDLSPFNTFTTKYNLHTYPPVLFHQIYVYNH